MSVDEEADLLSRWRRFKDEKARERVIEASLRLVPPIALRQARKFKLDSASKANANQAKNLGITFKLQQHSCARDLIGEGNLALTQAFDAFPAGANVRFAHYARPCVRNAIVRHAVSLLSAVNRPWGEPVKQDFSIDPMKPDLIGAEESTGCFQAKPTLGDRGQRRTKVFSQLRSEPEPPRCYEAIELPWVIEARLKGFKLKDIARELGVSIPTAHRRVKAAIEEVNQCQSRSQ
jgi:RNA polymerase sigma factor (sigma-70 family)